MLRKLTFALVTGAALGVAALTPSAASAHSFGGYHWGHWGGYWGSDFFRPGYRVAYWPDCAGQYWVHTKHGPRLRWINRCYY